MPKVYGDVQDDGNGFNGNRKIRSSRGFHVGWSGSPFHKGYVGNEGMLIGPGGHPSEMGPRIGSGAMKRRVDAEVNRDYTDGRRNMNDRDDD